jgi:hypothetical protein
MIALLSPVAIKWIINLMSDFENPIGSESTLKQKLLAALNTSISQANAEEASPEAHTSVPSAMEEDFASRPTELSPADRILPNGGSIYSILTEEEAPEPPLSEALQESRARLSWELKQVEHVEHVIQWDEPQKTQFDVTLSMRGVVPDGQTETLHPAGSPSSLSKVPQFKSNSIISGGSMADLSGYKDLSKAPISFGDDDLPMSNLNTDSGFDRGHHQPQQSQFQHNMNATQHFAQEATPQEVDTEFSGNVKTLIRLVNELPDGVTKQTGAQIIRLTMEAMGISMEDVLSEAQSAQSEMLDAVRANIKKIEEYKTVIRKLETDIKYYQGKANELSEIIDLFILSNTTGNKMPMPDDLSH